MEEAQSQWQVHVQDVKMEKLVLHRVGNKSREEDVEIAKDLLLLEEDLQKILLHYFMDSFKWEEFYHFNHETSLEMNEIFNYCRSIFESVDDNFYEESVHILKHLYEKSDHNKIKAGELYVAYFEDVVLEDELVNAIGIFKAENKDTYLKLKSDAEGSFSLDYEYGTNITKLDKGCLVFNLYEEEGYRVASVDLKSSDAKYWRDSFLMLTQIQDDGFHTKNYLDLCKDFGKKMLAEESTTKDEQVNFLNKSLDYFATREEFKEEEFKEEVFSEEAVELVDKFEEFKEEYNYKNSIEDRTEEGFFIENKAVKKAKRGFKNTIKLDTQMEIKIHTAQAQEDGFLEKGYDEIKQMSYYKVYFNEEN